LRKKAMWAVGKVHHIGASVAALALPVFSWSVI